MPIWRLQPTDPGDPNWEASSHCGPVTVRAANEAEARRLAQEAFGVRTRFALGRGVLAPPWLRPDLVSIEIVEGGDFAAEGPAEVLVPSFEEDLPHQPRRRTRAPARHGRITSRKTPGGT